MKICSRCREEKNSDEFRSHPKGKDGLQSRCRDCANEVYREIYRKNPEKYLEKKRKYRKENRDKILEQDKWYQMKKKYGITKKEYEEMLESQGEVCAICKIDSIKFHVDHCHTTGKIRGILCENCNIGLGRFKDIPEFLRSAADYLERTNA